MSSRSRVVESASTIRTASLAAFFALGSAGACTFETVPDLLSQQDSGEGLETGNSSQHTDDTNTGDDWDTNPEETPHGDDDDDDDDGPGDDDDDGADDDDDDDDSPGDDDTELIEDLLDLTEDCDPISSHYFASDFKEPPVIPVCALKGAVFWRADMDSSCDGEPGLVCNENVDGFDPYTAAKTSDGHPLDAAQLPFVLLPVPSKRFDHDFWDIELGSVVAVIYNGQLEFGAFANVGPDSIIGEASYALVDRFGVDPTPHHGGIPYGVTYIVFGGKNSVVDNIEDYDEAIAIGRFRARELTDHAR